MKRLKNILISMTLSVCMVVSSTPIEVLAGEAVPGQEESVQKEQSLYEIVSFEELGEEVRSRNVPVGTAPEDLNLPKTLTVSYRLHTKTQDGEEEADRNPDEDFEDKENENDPGDESEEEGNEGDPGGESEEEGNEGDPGDESGGEGNEGDPGDESEGEGNESDPGDESGGEGNESDPGDESEEEGNESDAGDGGSESNPGTDAEEEGTGNESGGNSGDEGNADDSGDASVDEAAMEQTTVEVHMQEYKSQPEIVVKPETLEPDGQEADSDNDLTGDQETAGEIDGNAGSDAEHDASRNIETADIENISWQSAPAYDGNTAGSYLFTPLLPEEYIPGAGVALPEITVTVGEDEELPYERAAGTPACGTISTDTVWDNIGILKDGELIVEPGVTLTFNQCIYIMGKVTIKGGGTIKRGGEKAYISADQGADLTIGEITLEGNFIVGKDRKPMIEVSDAKILLDDGCRIQNCCTMYWPAAVMIVRKGEAVLNDVTIMNCSGDSSVSHTDIGTIAIQDSSMTVNGGTYRDNKVKGVYAGSFVYSQRSKLYVNGGTFINNMVDGSTLGGCILDLGQSGNETHIYGGYFEGNKSASEVTSGGGAIHYISRAESVDNTLFELSGDVRFCGDGIDGSGTDGFFLDFSSYPRKIHVGSPIAFPVYFYLRAKEGYVIAKGSDNGYILTEKDVKQVRFTDVGNSGKQWYAWLDKENNEIRISEAKPPYGLYVYYYSNGAAGRVEDNTEYVNGSDVTVKSADTLSMKGHTFKEWNTKPDGTGTPYIPGSSFKITGDITLYAIFKEGRDVNASFFSGGAGSREVISAKIAADDDSATITAPDLKEMDGWTKVGWDEKTDGYTGAIAPGALLAISNDKSYFGVYKKNVTLSYDANGWLDASPAGQSKFRYANVHDEITDTPAEFVVGQDIRREGYTFLGWSLSKDAGGIWYGPEDTIALEDSAILYAQMVDDIAPVLGEAAYNSGYRDVGDWIVRKEDLIVTVPVTEEGSGVDKITYTFTPESGEPVTGEALLEDAGESGQVRRTEAVWLETDRAGGSSGEVEITDGRIQAKIIVSEDYKGVISLMCRDNAGNESPLKILTAQGGGVIVEDNAPLITFRNKDNKNGKAVVEVTVSDDVDENNNSHITGGIASVSYQTDKKQAQSVTNQGFAERIVETCTFDVEASGAGEHVIKVTATDNAGNESSRSTTVRVAGSTANTANKKETTVIQVNTPAAGETALTEPPPEESSAYEPPAKTREEKPSTEREPKTGDDLPHVEIYATIAMVSGLSYVALYLTAEPGGMTEAEKNEVVARLIDWAKRGKKLRRYVALAVIFCVLVYYHSIGKRSVYNLKYIRMTRGKNRTNGV